MNEAEQNQARRSHPDFTTLPQLFAFFGLILFKCKTAESSQYFLRRSITECFFFKSKTE